MPMLNRDGVNLYYEVHGDTGPVILLTHGYSATSQMWTGQIAELSKDHRLVIWDMRGHGQSDYPTDPAAYSEEATVSDMAAILDTLRLKSTTLLIRDDGVAAGLAFARRHPARVSASMLANPRWPGDGVRSPENSVTIAPAELLLPPEARATGRWTQAEFVAAQPLLAGLAPEMVELSVGGRAIAPSEARVELAAGDAPQGSAGLGFLHHALSSDRDAQFDCERAQCFSRRGVHLQRAAARA